MSKKQRKCDRCRGHRKSVTKQIAEGEVEQRLAIGQIERLLELRAAQVHLAHTSDDSWRGRFRRAFTQLISNAGHIARWLAYVYIPAVIHIILTQV